jgi:hypothetical protein
MVLRNFGIVLLHYTVCVHLEDGAPRTHWTVVWVGPRAGLDAVAKRKISLPSRESNPGRPARRLVTILTEPPWLHVSADAPSN